MRKNIINNMSFFIGFIRSSGIEIYQMNITIHSAFAIINQREEGIGAQVRIKFFKWLGNIDPLSYTSCNSLTLWPL